MPAITGFSVIDEAGFPVLSDPHGNNVAFRCLGCGSPVLAVAVTHQRGSAKTNPSVCPGCGAQFWIEVRVDESRVVVHRVKNQ